MKITNRYTGTVVFLSAVGIAIALFAWSKVLPPVTTWLIATGTAILRSGEPTVVAKPELVKLQDVICGYSNKDRCEASFTDGDSVAEITIDRDYRIFLNIRDSDGGSTMFSIAFDGVVREASWKRHEDHGYKDQYSQLEEIGLEHESDYQRLANINLRTILNHYLTRQASPKISV